MGHGPVDALVSAWPALALVGSFELLMMLIRFAQGTRRARVSAALPESSTSTAAGRSSASSTQRHDSANRLRTRSRFVTADTKFCSLLIRLIGVARPWARLIAATQTWSLCELHEHDARR